MPDFTEDELVLLKKVFHGEAAATTSEAEFERRVLRPSRPFFVATFIFFTVVVSVANPWSPIQYPFLLRAIWSAIAYIVFLLPIMLWYSLTKGQEKELKKKHCPRLGDCFIYTLGKYGLIGSVTAAVCAFWGAVIASNYYKPPATHAHFLHNFASSVAVGVTLGGLIGSLFGCIVALLYINPIELVLFSARLRSARQRLFRFRQN